VQKPHIPLLQNHQNNPFLSLSLSLSKKEEEEEEEEALILNRRSIEKQDCSYRTVLI